MKTAFLATMLCAFAITPQSKASDAVYTGIHSEGHNAESLALFPGRCCEEVTCVELWAGYCFEKRPPCSRLTLSLNRRCGRGCRCRNESACQTTGCPGCQTKASTQQPAPIAPEVLPKSDTDDETSGAASPSAETNSDATTLPTNDIAPEQSFDDTLLDSLPFNDPLEHDPFETDLPDSAVLLDDRAQAPEPPTVFNENDDDGIDTLVESDEFVIPENDLDFEVPELTEGEVDDESWDNLPVEPSDEEFQQSIEDEIKELLDSPIEIPDNAGNSVRKKNTHSLRHRLRTRAEMQTALKQRVGRSVSLVSQVRDYGASDHRRSNRGQATRLRGESNDPLSPPDLALIDHVETGSRGSAKPRLRQRIQNRVKTR